MLDLSTEPKLDSPVTEIEDRARHVLVPVLVHADRVAVSEPEQPGDAVGVNQVVEIYLSSHRPRLLSYSDPSDWRSRLL